MRALLVGMPSAGKSAALEELHRRFGRPVANIEWLADRGKARPDYGDRTFERMAEWFASYPNGVAAMTGCTPRAFITLDCVKARRLTVVVIQLVVEAEEWHRREASRTDRRPLAVWERPQLVTPLHRIDTTALTPGGVADAIEEFLRGDV